MDISIYIIVLFGIDRLTDLGIDTTYFNQITSLFDRYAELVMAVA